MSVSVSSPTYAQAREAVIPQRDPSISVCIATYRRPALLATLLEELFNQDLLAGQIVVVDNDAAQSAREVVTRLQAQAPGIELIYDTQPEKNISLTRNRTVTLATGAWLAFIDDDERAPSTWLRQLRDAAVQFNADGVLGPVVPGVPDNAPEWIRRGRFYDGPRMPTGTVVPLNVMRIGNAFLAAQRLRALSPCMFDPVYGLSGGEDGDVLMRMVNQGARIVWCDEAIAHEPVPESRMSLRWLTKRALRGGQDFARHFRAGKLVGQPGPGASMVFFSKAAVQMVIAGVLAVFTLPFGRHHAAGWLMKTYANFGKLSVLWGGRYLEYA